MSTGLIATMTHIYTHTCTLRQEQQPQQLQRQLTGGVLVLGGQLGHDALGGQLPLARPRLCVYVCVGGYDRSKNMEWGFSHSQPKEARLVGRSLHPRNHHPAARRWVRVICLPPGPRHHVMCVYSPIQSIILASPPPRPRIQSRCTHHAIGRRELDLELPLVAEVVVKEVWGACNRPTWGVCECQCPSNSMVVRRASLVIVVVEAGLRLWLPPPSHTHNSPAVDRPKSLKNILPPFFPCGCCVYVCMCVWYCLGA
jgi:hypothetical protein